MELWLLTRQRDFQLPEPLPGFDHQPLDIFLTQLENMSKVFSQRQNPLESKRPSRTNLPLVSQLASCDELVDKLLKCVLWQQSWRAFPDPQNHKQQLLLETISRASNPRLQPIACPLKGTKDLADPLPASWRACCFSPSGLWRFDFDLNVHTFR